MDIAAAELEAPQPDAPEPEAPEPESEDLPTEAAEDAAFRPVDPERPAPLAAMATTEEDDFATLPELDMLPLAAQSWSQGLPPRYGAGFGFSDDYTAEDDDDLFGIDDDDLYHAAQIAPEPDPAPVEDDAKPLILTQQVGGSSRPGDLISTYLAEGNLAAAAVLADACAKTGDAVPFSTSALALLALGQVVVAPRQTDTETFLNALDNSSLQLSELESGPPEMADTTTCLVVAALLRPALFSQGQYVRESLGSIRLTPSVEPYSKLVEALAELDYDVNWALADVNALSVADGKGGGPQGKSELLRAREDLRYFCSRTFNHAFRNVAILWDFYGSRDHSAFGLAKAIAADQPVDEAQITALIEELDGVPSAQIDALRRMENAAPFFNKLYPTTGNAEKWWRNTLQGCVTLLARWRAARKSHERDTAELKLDSPVYARLQRVVRDLRALAAPLAEIDDTPASGLHGLAQQILRTAVRDLSDILHGAVRPADLSTSPDPIQDLLLRLPAPCLPLWTASDVWPPVDTTLHQTERMNLAQTQRRALCEPSRISPSLEHAFANRLTEGAILPAEAILTRLWDREVISAKGRDEMRARLDSTVQKLRPAYLSRLRELRGMIAAALDLAPADRKEGNDWLNRLDLIEAALKVEPGSRGASKVMLPALNRERRPEVPPDFPELFLLLHRAKRFEGDLQTRIADLQRKRLEAVRDNNPRMSPHAKRLLDEGRKFMPITLDDIISDLEADREPETLAHGDPDFFDEFFPGFVEEQSRMALPSAAEYRKNLEKPGRPDPLGLRRLHPGEAALSLTLLANFASLKEAFASVGRTPEAAARLLDSFGFRGAFLKHEVDLGTMGAGRIERYRLTTQQVPRVARGFMPHAFGSSAKGTYQVAIASRYASQVHIYDAIDSEPQKPWILLHTDSISVKERQDLAATFRRDRRCVLILDAAMVAFAARRGGDPMETLMTCAAPFGWVQSFYTTPRTVPREMFFGRREEILKIISRTRDGCLMYGGRQLGKSALLTQVAREYHEPANGRLAVDIDIGELGSGAEAPVRIWSRIAQKLRPEAAPPYRGHARSPRGDPPWRDGLHLDLASGQSRWQHPGDVRRGRQLPADRVSGLLAAAAAEGPDGDQRIPLQVHLRRPAQRPPPGPGAEFAAGPPGGADLHRADERDGREPGRALSPGRPADAGGRVHLQHAADAA